MMKNEYFSINLEHLPSDEERTFPFHLYVYHPVNKTYTTFLYANSPFTPEKYEFLKFITSKGGKVAVSVNQQKTFLHALKLKQDEVEDLIEQPEHELITLQKKRMEQREKKMASSPKFHFKEQLVSATALDNWMPIINECREEAMSFPFTICHTVSLANYLAEHLLIEDNHTNRVVALSFQLAKGCGMNDAKALGDLICASYLSHIGHTQMDFLYSQKPFLELQTKQRNEYKKHPGLAQHLINKSQLIISERCNKILYQHHERYDGSGYPEYKQGAYIEPLALVLGASAHILEYMSGRITGTPVPLRTIIKNLKEKTLAPGLELEFGDTIYESLIYLLDNENKKAA